MKDKLNVSALFYKGKLFQIGDLIQCKVEFLDTINTQRFNHYDDGGFLTKINVGIDVICNSSYLNHGFTYSSIGSLGYTFEFDNEHEQYAFESDIVQFPHTIPDRVKYLDRYYLNPINKDKADNLIGYLDIKDTKKLGTYLKKCHRDIFGYICLTFRIRFGEFGRFSDSNELSAITFDVLRKYGGYDNRTTNLIHNIICNNKNEMGNSFFKNVYLHEKL